MSEAPPNKAPKGKAPMVRLDRLLANLGYGSRREVQDMVAAGVVVLDGEALPRADRRIALTPDLAGRMSVNGSRLDPPCPLTLVMYKPLGVVCSHTEPGRSVYELLPPRWRRREPALSTVGRLDKDTSGLLLLTDDGGLLHRIISPKAHLPKRYRFSLERPLSGDEAEVFASGTLMLEGETKPLAPAGLEVLNARAGWLTITEGRYHQVRRMFAAIGNHVSALHRDRIGGLDLPAGLAAGDYRPITEMELARVLG
jgi:16S rRNA pseudouridine516 synthase